MNVLEKQEQEFVTSYKNHMNNRGKIKEILEYSFVGFDLKLL